MLVVRRRANPKKRCALVQDVDAGLGTLAPISAVLCVVLEHYRVDRRGNVTVTSLLHESVNWRLVSKAFLDVSRETPTPYDATVEFFRGAPPYVPLSVCGGVAFGLARRFWLLRIAHTGEVLAITTNSKGGVAKRWSMRDLVLSLGGQNANCRTRITELASVIAGDTIPIPVCNVRSHTFRNTRGKEKVGKPPILHSHLGSSVKSTDLSEYNGQINCYRTDNVAFGVRRQLQKRGRFSYNKTSTFTFCQERAVPLGIVKDR